ncbi:uncharacterized protein LOC131019441 [Salvia miltiorrhiza]|uniref:uncharacterized protein LOC131019441 n=1 Tax=Salvia miltiorrhiza TaxID=226208 RepID=UPI0025ACC51D|nr:uncharacterized protein LOC131019441 [Salvia miltiorrhiza]
MKVHPVPGRRNITLRHDIASVLAQASICRQKKLRRLLHIFAKVLEIPLHSDADVLVVEILDSLIFTASADGIGSGVKADAVEIYPGVTKVVIRGNGVWLMFLGLNWSLICGSFGYRPQCGWSSPRRSTRTASWW